MKYIDFTYIQSLTPSQGQRLHLNGESKKPLIPRPATISRLSRVLLALMVGSAATIGWTQSLATEQASPADSFVDSMGVGTHFTYQNTLYWSAWPQVFADLQELGIRHIRDGYFDPNWGAPFTTRHQQLQQAGVRTDYVISYAHDVTPQTIAQLSAATGDMELLETPNECDLPGGCGAGTDETQSLSNMKSYLPMLKTAASNLNIPLIGPSYAAFESFALVGSVAPHITYSNLHVYYGGRYPESQGWGGFDAQGHSYGSIDFWLDQGQMEGPGLPSVITETGYDSYPGQLKQWTIPLTTEASYIPRAYLQSYLHGIGRTYQYELLEDPNSPGFGLIDLNLNKRPAFYAIKNLITNLADPGPSFEPGSLQYSVEGGDSTVSHLLLQKRDGSFWLILWLAQSSYDSINQVPTPVTPQQITLQLGGGVEAANIGRFSPSGNLTWLGAGSNGSTVKMKVSDQLTIVKILQQ